MGTAWIPKFPNCNVTHKLYFASALTSETILCGEMLGTPTHCHAFVIYDDTGQKTCLNSSLFDKNEHYYRNFNRSVGQLQILFGSCTDFNVYSGSCSSLKSKLQQESTQAP